MAESTTKTPKKTFKNRVQQLPKPPEEPAEPAATSPAEDPDAPETPPPAAKRGRPPKSDNVVPRSMTFFDNLPDNNSTPDQARQIEQVFGPDAGQYQGGKMALQRTLESVQLCIAWRGRQVWP